MLVNWTKSGCDPVDHTYEEIGMVGHLLYSLCSKCSCGRIQYSSDTGGTAREYLFKHEILDSKIIIAHIGWISGCWRHNRKSPL